MHSVNLPVPFDLMLSEAWNAATEEFSEDWPSTTVHQIQGARITLSVNYNQKDWGAMQEWISCACSTWHSKADSTSAAATPPVAEAAVSSTALSNAANSVGGYTAGTLGAMMHACVQWGFTGIEAGTRVANGVRMQPKRQNAHDAPSCPLSKFITTEASQGGVITLTTTKITRQHDIVSFC
jgi:urease accessory protein UreF